MRQSAINKDWKEIKGRLYREGGLCTAQRSLQAGTQGMVDWAVWQKELNEAYELERT